MPDEPTDAPTDTPRGAPQLLVPEVDDESAGFWEATARGVLAIQACGACGALRHPPRPMCPRCNATERVWREVSGRGTVWSYVVVHPPLLPAYAALAPYNVVVVALEEDPTIRLIGNLLADGITFDAGGARAESGAPDEGGAPDRAHPPAIEVGAPDAADPRTIEVGAPVRVVFEPRGDLHLPQWVRA